MNLSNYDVKYFGKRKHSKFFAHEYSVRVIFYIYPQCEEISREGKVDRETKGKLSNTL